MIKSIILFTFLLTYSLSSNADSFGPEPIYKVISCKSTGQECDIPARVVFNWAAEMSHSLSIIAPKTHCSKVAYKIKLYNTVIGTTPFLAAGEAAHFSIGFPSKGRYVFDVYAIGQRGGCNTGRLISWGVTLGVDSKAY